MKKRSFLLISVFLIALSCSDDGLQPKQTDIRVENGRLVFQDRESYNATLSQLKKTDNEGLAKWRNQFSFNSMYERLREFTKAEVRLPNEQVEYSMLPVGYTNILNSKGEVKIGDKIFWYSNGKIYRASTENELTNAKLNPSKAFAAGEYTISQADISTDRDEATGARYVKWYHGGANNWDDWSEGNVQTYTNQSSQFTSCTDGKTRKYVDKLISYVFFWYDEPGYHVYTTDLYLVLKLDYKNPSNDWVTSHASRKNNYGFQANIVSTDPFGNDTYVNQYFSGSVTGTDHVWIPLMIDEYEKHSDGYMGWHDVTIVGTIGHDLVNGGGFCHHWDNIW